MPPQETAKHHPSDTSLTHTIRAESTAPLCYSSVTPCFSLLSACQEHKTTQFHVLRGIPIWRKVEPKIAFSVCALLTSHSVLSLQLPKHKFGYSAPPASLSMI